MNTIPLEQKEPTIIDKSQWNLPIGFLDTDGSQLNPWTQKPYQNLYVNAEKFPNTFAGYTQNTQKLPVFQKYQEFLETLAKHQVVFVTSGTGSGKTVMVPRFLEHLYGYQAKMIVTIPRQESVREMAVYQAKLNDVVLGEEVGYAFRGDKNYQPNITKLLFATDGLLVRKLLNDPLLTGYQAVIVDEAHERNVQIDFLLYLLRRVFTYRSDFRLVIMSAEAPVTLFEKYFSGKQYNFVEINAGSKTTFPIEDIYLNSPLSNPTEYLPPAIDRIIELLTTTKKGDILAFVNSSSEAQKGCRLLSQKLQKLGGDIHPTTETNNGNEQNLVLFCGQGSANMSNRNKKLLLEAKAYQEEVNEKTKKKYNRRITFVTNVAESSITLEGYTFVIDNGYSLVDYYEPEHMASHLRSERISKAQQIQRRGRVGRVGPGIAYYLYTKKEQESFNDFPPSQISRSDLSESILNFLMLPDINTIADLGSLMNELIEPPKLISIEVALFQLSLLGWTNNDYQPYKAKKLTELSGTFSQRGLFMIKTFKGSVTASTAEALVSAWDNHVSNEVCGVFAIIDATRGGDLNKLINPKTKDDKQKEKKRLQLLSKSGTIASLINLWNKYNQNKKDKEKWAETHGFLLKTLNKADNAYRRLRYQTLQQLRDSLRESPLNKSKNTNDFMVEGSEDLDLPMENRKELVMLMMDSQVGAKSATDKENEKKAIISIAKGYWIFSGYRKPKSKDWNACIAPKNTHLTLSDDSVLLSKPPTWLFSISWGGFGDKTQFELEQKYPDKIKPEEIHVNLPEIMKICMKPNKNRKEKQKKDGQSKKQNTTKQKQKKENSRNSTIQ